ncbi:MAG: lysophospholipid acyltransferase family protein [Candidatus Omnitrophota bacterium]
MKSFLKFFLGLFFKLKIEGIENLPSKTNFIIVSNHVSWLDPVCFVAIMPYRFYGIAARYLYKEEWVRWFCERIGAIPSGDSSEKMISLLNSNKNVGLFPEGGCSYDGKLKAFKNGAALLAMRTGRPIVPCAIVGTYESLPVDASFPKLFLPIIIKIGKPIYLLKEFDEIIEDIDLQEGILKVRNSIKAMLNAG